MERTVAGSLVRPVQDGTPLIVGGITGGLALNGADVFETIAIIRWSTEGGRGPSSRSEWVALQGEDRGSLPNAQTKTRPLTYFVSAGKTAISTFTFDVLWRKTLFIQS